MAICLVLHELPAGGAEALEAAVWELSESHWAMPGGIVVQTGVSPGYLLTHLRVALERAGLEGRLLVARTSGGLHLAGMEPAAEAWAREVVVAEEG